MEFPFFFDHAPVLLQLRLSELTRSSLFRFNHSWLTSTDYIVLVHSIWKDPIFTSEVDPQLRLVWKLKVLKSKTRSWFHCKQVEDQARLLSLEAETSNLSHCSISSAWSVEESNKLKGLEATRASILLAEEFAWRLRSRATWLKSGDSNSKFFHKVVSFNKHKKLIWTIKSRGRDVRGQEALKDEAVTHFSQLYKAPCAHNLWEKVSTAGLFPQLVAEDEAEALYKPVTLAEIKDILSHFKTERSPGPEGWTSEFFCFFFDLVGEELLQMVEDTRIKGKIAGGINSTLLVLIPKDISPTSFNDYRLISLCNLIYKIISKVISNRLKPFLGRSLSAEQLGFLKGRRIQDAIGAVHECLHNIKQKNLKVLVMKLDLKKDFDCIDWDFLRLILHAVGFEDKFIN